MLEISDISKTFSGKRTLHDVSLNVGDGEFLSILGPSGCGKTTLLRIVAGLETPDAGSVRLAEREITKLPAHKRNIHTVFQRYALFPHMNVFENVAFGLRCKRVSRAEIKKRVEEMLALANLQGHAQRKIQTLSGGEQQRVALVRALVNMPELLLLDEPLGALDLKLRLQLQEELVALQKRVKTTFIFVTHDQQEALNMSDRVAVMNQGHIEQVGTPVEIYEFPKTFFVAHFVGQLNRMDGKVRRDEGGRFICDIADVGQVFIEPTNGEVNDSTSGALCLRPEKVTVYARRPSTADNIIEGVIHSLAYLGTHNQFVVRLKNGHMMTVFQQNSQKLFKRAYSQGDRVYVAWQASHSHFFRETPSS